jgi:hypothetical protein
MIENLAAPVFKVGHDRAVKSRNIDLAVENVDNCALDRAAVWSITDTIGRRVVGVLVEGLGMLRAIGTGCG